MKLCVRVCVCASERASERVCVCDTCMGTHVTRLLWTLHWSASCWLTRTRWLALDTGYCSCWGTSLDTGYCSCWGTSLDTGYCSCWGTQCWPYFKLTASSSVNDRNWSKENGLLSTSHILSIYLYISTYILKYPHPVYIYIYFCLGYFSMVPLTIVYWVITLQLCSCCCTFHYAPSQCCMLGPLQILLGGHGFNIACRMCSQ